MRESNEDPGLGEKDQEIIAVGASVATSCLPCTKFHLRAASSAGANKEEILQAVRDAVRVRTAATAFMAKAGGLVSDETNRPIQESEEIRTLIRELVSISAAYAVNCSTNLATHMTAARSLGATDQQMLTAIKIACAVRDVAVQKAKAAAGAVLGVSEEQAVACGCADEDTQSERQEEVCSCRTEDTRRSNK